MSECPEGDEHERRLEQYRALTEAANDVIVTIDEDSIVQSVNPAVEGVFGYSREEVIGERLALLMPDELVERHRNAVARYLETGERRVDWDYVELPGQRADGARIPLAVSFSEIEYRGDCYFTGIVRDITERKEIERRLEESNERLEQFAYAASHDLQEPLRMVRSYLHLIERRHGADFDEEGREFLEYALDGAERMSAMIDGLLSYSRIDTGGDEFVTVDLDAVLADVRADLRLRIENSDAEITAESLPTVEGDAGQLRQLFQNLLDNAIAYSGDERPRIRISIERDGGEWLVSVGDEGIGVDPEHAEQVFEVFERLHGQDEPAGTGIGLALCRRIVERHGGRIWLDSEPGEGTTVSFTLPVADGER